MPDLMSALKASLDAVRKDGKAAATAPARRPKATARRKKAPAKKSTPQRRAARQGEK